jgi:hypothetical protein
MNSAGKKTNKMANKKTIAKKMKSGVVAQTNAPQGYKDWDSYYGRSPSKNSGKTSGSFRGTKKEYVKKHHNDLMKYETN